jgi:hypothetical protein
MVAVGGGQDTEEEQKGMEQEGQEEWGGREEQVGMDSTHLV